MTAQSKKSSGSLGLWTLVDVTMSSNALEPALGCCLRLAALGMLVCGLKLQPGGVLDGSFTGACAGITPNYGPTTNDYD